MSMRAMLYVKQLQGVSSGQKCLLFALADEADSNGLLFGLTGSGAEWNYSRAYYERVCCASESAVKNWFRELEGKKILKRHATGDRSGSRNKFQIVMPDSFATKLVDPKGGIPAFNSGGVDSDLGGHASSKKGGSESGFKGGSDSDLGQNQPKLEADSDPQRGSESDPYPTVINPTVPTGEISEEKIVQPFSKEREYWRQLASEHVDSFPELNELSEADLQARDLPVGFPLRPLRMMVKSCGPVNVPVGLWLDWLICAGVTVHTFMPQLDRLLACANAEQVDPAAVLLYSLEKYRDNSVPVARRVPCFPQTPRPVADREPSSSSKRAAKSAPTREYVA